MFKNAFHPTVLMAMALWAVVAAPGALAAPTFVVNSTLDQPDDLTMIGTCHTAANTCTLRAAVMQANRSSGVGATIMVPAGTYTLTIPATVADGEGDGDLNLTTPVSGNPVITITGAGAATTIIDANQLDRVFRVHGNRTATISGVTIRNGFAAGDDGGGISNEGSLTVHNVVITENHAAFSGGGIANNASIASLTMTNSTISKNSADLDGGGLYIEGTVTVLDSTLSQNHATIEGGGIINNGTVYVRNSTIDNNDAGSSGGGIDNHSVNSSLYVVNSTISLNNTNGDGGGVYNSSGATANVYSTTIVYNGADADRDGGSAGGVFNDDASGAVFNMRNTLLAGNNVGDTPIFDDCTGTLNSYGVNVVAVGTDDPSCTVVIADEGVYFTLDSLSNLGPLQDNGGPTRTVALLPGSDAIDNGDFVLGCIDYSGPLATDQRGQPRVVGGRCDIGAFEYSALSPPAFVSAVSRKVHGAAGTFDLSLSAVTTNPTTEPRQGPAQTIVFTFDKAINSAIATVTEGTALAGAPTFSGNDVVVGLTGVNNQQYVTIALTAVAGADGSTGGSGSVRVGFLAGDVNQNRVVSLADLGLVNAQLAQTVTASNYLKDVNASGTLSLADKGITNANLTRALPAP